MELLVAQIPTSDPNVLGDRIQLQQVIVNVLLNGIQAISHAGTDRRQIVVETSYGLDGVTMLSVEDTGGGIASDHLSRIFDGFFSTKADGVGIGLAICRFIVADHQGAISVENEAGVGARYLVTLPAISDGEVSNDGGKVADSSALAPTRTRGNR